MNHASNNVWSCGLSSHAPSGGWFEQWGGGDHAQEDDLVRPNGEKVSLYPTGA